MTPLLWIQMFAQFVGLQPSVVNEFVDEHPELKDPPKPDQQSALDSAFDAAVDKKFPKE